MGCTLSYRGGGKFEGFGDPVTLGCHLLDHVGYITFILSVYQSFTSFINNVHVVQFPMLSFLSCSHSMNQP